jgi:hypothetical protein
LRQTLRSLIRRKETTMEFLNDLWGFLNQRKKFWLLPVIMVLVGFGVVIALAAGSAIAPFIYTLF